MRTVLLALTMFLTQAPQTPPVTRDIRGVVISIGTPDAVPDAEISVGIDKSDLDTVIAAYKYNQKFPMRTTSDGSGHFSLGGLVPGKFIVTVQCDGFFAEAPDPKGNIRDTVSIPVTVAADKDGSEISISMLAGAVIGGRVFGIDGQAVPRVTVRAFTQYTESGVQKLKPVAARDSNDEGAYRLFWVPPGEYIVGVSPESPPQGPAFVITGVSSQLYLKTFYPNAADEWVSSPVTVKSGDDITSIDISLRPGPRNLKIPPPPPPPPPPPAR
jgi:hypothetical protein